MTDERCPACLNPIEPHQRYCLECGERMASAAAPPASGQQRWWRRARPPAPAGVGAIVDAATRQRRCGNCLAVVEASQRYCLDCGQRLADPGLPASGTLVSSVPAPAVQYWAAAAVLVLAAGLGIAWGATRSTSTRHGAAGAAHSTTRVVTIGTTGPRVQTTTSPRTPSIPGLLPPIASQPATSPTATNPASLPTTSTIPPPATTASQPFTSDWPPGVSGFAAILASRAVTGPTDPFASQKLAAIHAGIANAGVLKSSDYGSLRPGYWVLFQGPYSTRAAAAVAARRAAASYPGAYVRRVAP